MRPERFELPTPWFVAKYSIQMSYGRLPRIITESWVYPDSRQHASCYSTTALTIQHWPAQTSKKRVRAPTEELSHALVRSGEMPEWPYPGFESLSLRQHPIYCNGLLALLDIHTQRHTQMSTAWLTSQPLRLRTPQAFNRGGPANQDKDISEVLFYSAAKSPRSTEDDVPAVTSRHSLIHNNCPTARHHL